MTQPTDLERAISWLIQNADCIISNLRSADPDPDGPNPRLWRRCDRALLDLRNLTPTDAGEGLVESLFPAIAHGDQEHRDWLEKAIEDHFAGRPVERPRGKGASEEVERLQGALDEARTVVHCIYPYRHRLTPEQRNAILDLRHALGALSHQGANHDRG